MFKQADLENLRAATELIETAQEIIREILERHRLDETLPIIADLDDSLRTANHARRQIADRIV